MATYGGANDFTMELYSDPHAIIRMVYGNMFSEAQGNYIPLKQFFNSRYGLTKDAISFPIMKNGARFQDKNIRNVAGGRKYVKAKELPLILIPKLCVSSIDNTIDQILMDLNLGLQHMKHIKDSATLNENQDILDPLWDLVVAKKIKTIVDKAPTGGTKLASGDTIPAGGTLPFNHDVLAGGKSEMEEIGIFDKNRVILTSPTIGNNLLIKREVSGAEFAKTAGQLPAGAIVDPLLGMDLATSSTFKDNEGYEWGFPDEDQIAAAVKDAKKVAGRKLKITYLLHQQAIGYGEWTPTMDTDTHKREDCLDIIAKIVCGALVVDPDWVIAIISSEKSFN
ncbi:MAG: hypothetical protein OEZ01_00180 [Candidatus Heimdallarchaeota archaeon]|nr:hypothetical protein [Candidatus Heimdallarchaeota archaeon]